MMPGHRYFPLMAESTSNRSGEGPSNWGSSNHNQKNENDDQMQKKVFLVRKMGQRETLPNELKTENTRCVGYYR
jgi:hypothetical protein